MEELYEEVDSETPEELKKKLNNKIKPNMIDTKKIGDKVTYVFTGAKVNDLNKMLGHHLKRRKATFKYTTPYWVRRGHFRTSRSGERVWVSEQVCKRDPELLSVKVDEDDSTGRIYRATNLF